MLSWASRFDICCFLDNHQYQLPSQQIECLLAAGARHFFQANAGNALEELQMFLQQHHILEPDWVFGHFGYGLTKETEPVHGIAAGSKPGRTDADPVGFPDCCFFVPEVLLELKEDVIRIGVLQEDPAGIFKQILQSPAEQAVPGQKAAVLQASAGGNLQDPASPQNTAGPDPMPRFSREEYIAVIRRLQEHILRGDCYEINFCQEFFASPAIIDPLRTWWRLSQASPNPFATFYRIKDSYLLCASPERYLQRSGDHLLSQPIKGTTPRFPADLRADAASRDRLYNSSKDRAENVMVVDLVRNDLSRICREGTVKVDELYGIYSFPHVHQMISTVSGELRPGLGLTDCIRATFPMGSMTGAPKKRVVELTAAYERSARGIFSGAVGYMDPQGNFDFNVVIRSILYNSHTRYLSYLVGSGITWYSDPAAEYEECLWKAQGMKRALGNS